MAYLYSQGYYYFPTLDSVPFLHLGFLGYLLNLDLFPPRAPSISLRCGRPSSCCNPCAFGSFINRYMCFILSLLIHHSHYSFLLILFFVTFFRLSSSSFQCHLITIGVLCIYFIPICTIYFHSITLLFFSFDTLKMEHCGLFFPLYFVHILFYIQVCSSFF